MGLLPLWGMWRAPGSFSEVSHQATTVFSRIWQIHFSRGIFGKIETSFCEENTSDETKEHLSEERWGSFSDICLILISPPISLVFTVVFLYFSGTARRKVEVHSFCWHHTPLPFFLSVSSVFWNESWSSVCLLTPCCGSSSWEHRVFGFVWFGLKICRGWKRESLANGLINMKGIWVRKPLWTKQVLIALRHVSLGT